jgi:hypothetical protein
MGGAVLRALTLRRVGIAGAIAGVIALAAPFAPAAWAWFWPDPMATIDSPKTDTSLHGCFVIRGRLDPTTFYRRPLWLITAREGRGWRPLTRIMPWANDWQSRVCVRGQTGDRNQFTLVVADDERDQAFARALLEPPDEEIPDWLKPRSYTDKCCPGRRLGFDPFPSGARMVDSVQVRVRARRVAPPGAYAVGGR